MDDMRQHRNYVGFTLIELLVVIAIIAILATLIAGAGIRASEGRKIARVKAEKDKLVTAIEQLSEQKR